MRLALLISARGVNGVAVHCHLLVKYLLAQGHDVLLLHRPGAWIAIQAGLECVQRAETSFSRGPKELIRIGRLIEAFGAEVMHTHMSSAHTYGAAGRLFGRLPVVATAHVPHFQLHWALNHLVIATSQQVADYNTRYNGVARGKIRVIPTFIETSRLNPPTDAERRAARRQLGLAQDAFVVGSVGHLNTYKRPADLVRAFAPLAQRDPAARLVFIGNAQTEAGAATRALAAHLGFMDRLVLTGARDDASSLLAAMDVFALASGRESAPLAILEAMARGLPVVATRTGMIADMVLEGRSGYVTTVGDTAALGACLLALAGDASQRAAFGAAGREHVVANFSMQNVAPRIEQALMDAVTIRNRPLLGWIGKVAARLVKG
jgi:glycosyltransferase involved in cell wall biosynthesis